MRKSIKHQIWLGVTTISLSVGVLATVPTNANAALKWHKGTPSILNGKKYRTKLLKNNSPVATTRAYLKGTKSTVHYLGVQSPTYAKSVQYKKSGSLYLIRGKYSAKDKGYTYFKVKQISSKKIYVKTGGSYSNNGKIYYSTQDSMTRY